MVGSAIIANNLTWSAWRTMFWLAAAIYVAGNCFYVWLVKGEPQWWDGENKVEEEEEDEKGFENVSLN